MKSAAAIIVCILSVTLVSAQHNTPIKGDNPIIFVDSVRINRADLQKTNPDKIALVTVYKESATKILPEAKDGLIYIETKKFATSRYQRFFKSQSKTYGDLLLSPTADDDIQYILNGKILSENFEGDLASINQTTFKSIAIISASDLATTYGIRDKKTGVVIIADKANNPPVEIWLR